MLEDWAGGSALFRVGLRRCIERFEAQVARAPDGVAVAFEEHVTYGELNARANRLAHTAARWEWARGRWSACAERSIDLVVGLLGILKAGGAYVPLDPGYPAERSRSWSRTRVSGDRVRRSITGALPARSRRRGPARRRCGRDRRRRERPAAPARRPDNSAYVIYTSGSTGKPKGVLVTHAQRGAAVRGDRRLVRLRHQRRVDAVPLVRLRLLGVGDLGRAALRRPAGGRARTG